MSERRREPSDRDRVVVIGAGPAGLTAAHELTRIGYPCVVYEKDDIVGGISRTVEYRGYRFDIGGHRFFTKVEEIEGLWNEIMGDDFLVRPRLSRIYYRDRFFDYPLRPVSTLRGLGLVESVRIALSYLRIRLFPLPDESTFEQWVTNRFGRRLYEIFFKTYTEKVWGMPCHKIGADWAAQRIKNLDLASAVRHAFLGGRKRDGSVITTLIDRFHYPPHGPGMMWERWRDRLAEAGVETRMRATVTGVHHAGGRIEGVSVRYDDGRTERVSAAQVVSSMPIKELIASLDPPAPPDIRAAAERLRYRDFLTVVLIVDEADLFPDNWIYIHSPDVRVGRVQNFKNWSPAMVADASKTSLGLEYFVQEGDELWSADDAFLLDLGAAELERLGLIDRDRVVDGTVVRMPKAYPVYDHAYRGALSEIRGFLEALPDLYPVGRNGQHRYNNQDHSMVTALYAARNIAGADHDLWDVNVDKEYHEEKRKDAAGTDAVVGRLVPSTAQRRSLEQTLRRAFARYDARALGVAVGTVSAGVVLALTAMALIRGGDPRPLSLLGEYVIGYRVSWWGAGFGAIALGAAGFVYGYVLARLINKMIDWEETLLKRRLQVARTLDPLDIDD